MPEAVNKPVYLVDAYSDPALVRIEGRASFNNSGCLKDFFTEMLKQGKARFVLDFEHCTSMDSTFLGVLAGTAMELRRLQPPGSLTLCRVGARNLELVRNLGLHRLLNVDVGNLAVPASGTQEGLACPDRTEMENAKLVLEAHENLVAADERNQAKFQDVLSFLKNRAEKK